MMSVSDGGSSRYQPHPDHFNWELRAFFSYFLVREEAFKTEMERLKPLWERVKGDHPALDAQISYGRLPASADPMSALNVYIASLRVSVSDGLRCRVGGAPADWVCQAMHGGVTGGSMVEGRGEQEHYLWMGRLLIPVMSFGAALVMPQIGDHNLISQEEIDRAHSLDATRPGSAFDQWGKLKKLAHADLDLLLDALRKQQAQATEHWPSMNRGGRDKRRFETMECLVNWLVGGESLWASDRPNAHALLKEIGLDQPGAVEKNASHVE